MLELKSRRRKEVRMGLARSGLVDVNKGRAFYLMALVSFENRAGYL